MNYNHDARCYRRLLTFDMIGIWVTQSFGKVNTASLLISFSLYFYFGDLSWQDVHAFLIYPPVGHHAREKKNADLFSRQTWACLSSVS